MKPLIDWLAHGRAFWPEWAQRRERQLENLEG